MKKTTIIFRIIFRNLMFTSIGFFAAGVVVALLLSQIVGGHLVPFFPDEVPLAMTWICTAIPLSCVVSTIACGWASCDLKEHALYSTIFGAEAYGFAFGLWAFLQF